MIAALLLVSLQSAGPPLARTSSIPIAAGVVLEEALTCDLSGDDVADLLLATRPERPPGARTAPRARLSVHVRRAEAAPFRAAPDASLELSPDVLAFAACDVLPADAGREILLFNASGVFAWRWREADEAQRLVRLLDADLLWQIPASGTLFHLQAGIADLDGDGLEDLCIPEPGGARVAFQRAGSAAPRFGPSTRLVVPVDVLDDGEVGSRVRLRSTGGRRRAALELGDAFDLSEGDGRTGPYLELEDSAPRFELSDWDGDGDLDLLALSDAALHVWIQEPRGTFDPARKLELASPVPRDRRRALDVSFQVRALDLDRDARVDLVFFAQDRRSDAARTQALVFRQAATPAGEPPLFGREGKPVEVLVLDGFARPLALEDVDGDGYPDLVAAALRPNLIDALRSAASERVDTELYVFLNRGGRGFSRRPDLVRVLSIQAGGDRDESGAGRRTDMPFLADFVGDVTGDGVADLFVRTERDRLRVHLVRRGRDGALSVVDAPLFELALHPRARVLLPRGITPRTPDVFVLEPGAVVCASFR
ncbi:MAG: VCBS repeat-containing protein [Planctomycetes bacterium]|nr:VCBS repeat-containing protein [Planctomycetota bacterium]